MKVMFSWLMERTSLKDELRCAMMESGRVCVATCGAERKQLLSVDRLDSMEN